MFISKFQEDGGKGVSWFGGGGRASYVVMIWAEQRDRKRQIEELKPTKKSIVITNHHDLKTSSVKIFCWIIEHILNLMYDMRLIFVQM